ncbi:hypothetical protein [Aeromicrobium phragmitis]|nr:hypothetical protein [Aeromicrobium phragmitis]
MTVVPGIGWPVLEAQPLVDELGPESAAPIGWQVPRETTKD